MNNVCKVYHLQIIFLNIWFFFPPPLKKTTLIFVICFFYSILVAILIPFLPLYLPAFFRYLSLYWVCQTLELNPLFNPLFSFYFPCFGDILYQLILYSLLLCHLSTFFTELDKNKSHSLTRRDDITDRKLLKLGSRVIKKCLCIPDSNAFSGKIYLWSFFSFILPTTIICCVII